MWNELWQHHRGKLIGIAGGVLLAAIYLFSGFWDMLIVAVILAVGYTIGDRIDRSERVFPWERLLDWVTKQWRMFK